MADSILIVDGDDGYRASLVDYFRAREFEATGLNDYAKAVALIAGKKFDIAIIDYFIGTNSGSGLCEAIREWYRGDTALIIQSETQSIAIELSIRAHAPAIFLVKPAPVDNLYAVVLKIMKTHETPVFKKTKMAAIA